MATLAVMAGGAVVNSIAFSLGNFLFGKLGDRGSEIKRHDLVVEELSKARERFNRQRQERLDLVNKTIQNERHASQTFSDLGLAMQEYYKVTNHQLPPLREPKLSDFYNPSRSRKDNELALVIAGMAVVGIYVFNKS